MMKLNYLVLLTFILLSLSNNFTYSQTEESCKVLISEISEKYEGDCKNGLAHGTGVAKGIDLYEGRFKKGIPNGKGKYTWQNGDYYDGNWKEGKRNGRGIMYQVKTDKKVLGVWKDDEFIKEITEPAYKVHRAINVSGVEITENTGGAPNSVSVYFNRDGRVTRTVNSLLLIGSSGSINQTTNFCGFENVSYPLEGKITFTTTNRLNVGNIRCEVEFKIEKEGAWKVVIRY